MNKGAGRKCAPDGDQAGPGLSRRRAPMMIDAQILVCRDSVDAQTESDTVRSVTKIRKVYGTRKSKRSLVNHGMSGTYINEVMIRRDVLELLTDATMTVTATT